MNENNLSPIQFTLNIISRKWAIEILCALHSGRKRYSDLLLINEQISSKVLSERLKELYELGIIDKIVINIIPIKAKYQLTKKGELLMPILLDMGLFSALNFSKDVFGQRQIEEKELISFFKKTFTLNKNDLNTIKNKIKEGNDI